MFFIWGVFHPCQQVSLNFPLFPENVNVISMAPVLVWKQFKVHSPCCLCYVHCLYVDRFIIVQLWFQNEFTLMCMSKNVCNLKDCEIPKFCQRSLNVMNFKIKMSSFVFGFLCYQRNIWFRITGNNNVCIFQGTKHKSGNLNLLENTVSHH